MFFKQKRSTLTPKADKDVVLNSLGIGFKLLQVAVLAVLGLRLHPSHVHALVDEALQPLLF